MRPTSLVVAQPVDNACVRQVPKRTVGPHLASNFTLDMTSYMQYMAESTKKVSLEGLCVEWWKESSWTTSNPRTEEATLLDLGQWYD